MSKTPFYSHFTKKTPKNKQKKIITLRIKSTTATLPAFKCTDYKLDRFGVFTTKTKTKITPRDQVPDKDSRSKFLLLQF